MHGSNIRCPKQKTNFSLLLYAFSFNHIQKTVFTGLCMYPSMKGCLSLGGTVFPKSSVSSASRSNTLRTTSPRYIPESNFS